MHVFVFFFNDTATTEIYTLSLHDALPIFASGSGAAELDAAGGLAGQLAGRVDDLAHQSSGDQSQRDVAAFPQLEQQRVVSQAPEATERRMGPRGITSAEVGEQRLRPQAVGEGDPHREPRALARD